MKGEFGLTPEQKDQRYEENLKYVQKGDKLRKIIKEKRTGY